MKAVIMAGGEGTRLRPLTCDLPKPMARLCGRPVLEYTLDLLKEHGCTEAAITLRYIPSAVTERFADGYPGLPLCFSEEEQPLGTAGSVRLAVDSQWGTPPDELVVISGDALTDVDLTQALDFHRQHQAAVTLVVKRVEDPREYGLVEYGRDGRVTGFLEKPGWGQADTDTANTGIYILSPEALAAIPAGVACDFAKDLFPRLLQEGEPLYAYETTAYWCDMGDLNTYRSCQQDILEGRVQTRLQPVDGLLLEGQRPAGHYELLPPVYIGRDVEIGSAARIGPFAVLGDGCRVGNNAKVRGSVLLEGSYVGDGASLTGTVVAHGASIRRGASLFEGAAVGEGAVIGEHAAIGPGVKVWPEKVVEPHVCLREHLRTGQGYASRFDDGGLCGETGVELTPEFCARLGAAVGSLSRGEKIAVGCSHDHAAAALKMALTAGILSTGGLVWDFGDCIPPQFDFFVGFSRLHMGVYIQGGAQGSILLRELGGLPASRDRERAVETCLATGDFVRTGWDTVQTPTNMTSMRQLYRQELIRMAPDGLAGLRVEIRGSDYEPVQLLSTALSTAGCAIDGGLRMHLGAGGRRLSLFDPEVGYIWPERVLALNCLISLECGEDLALPDEAPLAIDDMASHYGRAVHRYLSCPVEGCDAEARRLAAGQPWVRDGLMMAVRLLSRMKQTAVPLRELLSRLPDFGVARRTVPCDENPGRLLRTFLEQSGQLPSHTTSFPGEGVRIRLRGGSGLVRPSKAGKMLTLITEAASGEFAEELCGELEAQVRTALLDITGKKR